MNREKIEAEKLAKLAAEEPQKKKRKSSAAPLPLERPEGMPPSPLPDLPDDLKQKQEALGARAPTPPKQAKPSTPRGKVHATGPIIPPSTKPKGMFVYYFNV